MNTTASAKITMREIEREIDKSKVIDLLRDAYNIIEALMEEIDSLETTLEHKDDEISEMQKLIDEANNE